MKLLHPLALFESSQIYQYPQWAKSAHIYEPETKKMQESLTDKKNLQYYFLAAKIQLLAKHPIFKECPFSNTELLQLLEYAIVKNKPGSKYSTYKYDFTRQLWYPPMPNSKYYDTKSISPELNGSSLHYIKPKLF